MKRIMNKLLRKLWGATSAQAYPKVVFPFHPALAPAYVRQRERPMSLRRNWFEGDANTRSLEAERLLQRLRDAGY
ncbi:hypothetical protein [Methylococcus sp. EFPC2]|uniref:hypothetical protein n=1 Tax=Methylococcus sp. EFPC2 TaxID=2812648 RepID=UPI00196758E2|nr:hypothetical protein [Methylococcus sp. EFPC2]QSA96158.1 hypothetical protein JWZ97_13060 [Methylococcus sp. EFPC2]